MERRLLTDATRLGTAVRDWRLRAGLTQAEVANVAGVSRAWVVKFEDGHPRAELRLVFAVLRAVGAELWFGTAAADEEGRAQESFLNDLLGEKQ